MRCEKLHLKDYYAFLGTDGADPTLSLFLPYNMKEMGRENQKRPSILVCPGGAYAHCSQRESEPIALHFLPEGYNVFVLTYTNAPHRFPTQLREVAAAMELICQNADDWNCDPERVAIMGFSAGGHLAAHYSTCYDCAAVREVFPDSKKVKGSVLCYPVITADPAFAHKGSIKNLVGYYPETQEELDFFSCDRQVREDTPPAFLWHTATDNAVPVMNTLLYAGALHCHGIPAEVHIYPAGAHGLATVDNQTNGELDPITCRAHGWLELAKLWLKENI